ncbi:MAG: hypothetical protein ACRDYC_02455, partial [Acidimicrobiales bacterium]
VYGLGRGEAVVVVVVAKSHPRQTDGSVVGRVLRYDRASGELVGATRRDGLCRALVVHDRHAWIQMGPEPRPRLQREAPLEEATSVVERVDLGTGALTYCATLAGDVEQLTGSANDLWGNGFSARAQWPWVARVNTAKRTLDQPVDFAGIDMSESPLPPRRPRWRPKGMPDPPARQPATTPAEVEQRTLVELDDRVRNPVNYDAEGNRRPPRPWIGGYDFEPVRLAGRYPHTRVQLVFRSEHHADCRYGFEWPLWDEDGDWNWVWDQRSGLPDPEEEAGRLAQRLEEILMTRAVLPDRCAPDLEGITWAVNPSYFGKARADYTFGELVEWALNRRWPSRRPFSREIVEALLAQGMTSLDDLVPVIEGDEVGGDVALWLMTTLDPERAVGLLLGRIEAGMVTARLRAVERLEPIARSCDEARLSQHFRVEGSPEVRAAILKTL